MSMKGGCVPQSCRLGLLAHISLKGYCQKKERASAGGRGGEMATLMQLLVGM